MNPVIFSTLLKSSTCRWLAIHRTYEKSVHQLSWLVCLFMGADSPCLHNTFPAALVCSPSPFCFPSRHWRRKRQDWLVGWHSSLWRGWKEESNVYGCFLWTGHKLVLVCGGFLSVLEQMEYAKTEIQILTECKPSGWSWASWHLDQQVSEAHLFGPECFSWSQHFRDSCNLVRV